MLSMAKDRKPKKAPNQWPAKLSALQELLGKTNEEMAAHLDISLHTYLAWKYGKRQPSPLALRAVQHKLK